MFLDAAKPRRIQFKLIKCRFAQEWVKVLGFRIGRGTRMADPDKIKALQNWPDPSSLDDIVSFRAFANFVNEFIPTFQEHDRYLRPYTKKGVRFADYQKDEQAKAAFAALRQALAQDAALHVPDYAAAADPTSGRPFELYIDASEFAWGCCLAQMGQKRRSSACRGRVQQSFHGDRAGLVHLRARVVRTPRVPRIG